jgi:hypothetical protein
MQQALEAGQLDRVSDMLGIPQVQIDDKEQKLSPDDDESSDEDNNFFNDFDDMFEEDSC